eukprot:9801473-Alexandrium_andersonii.AAC.1
MAPPQRSAACCSTSTQYKRTVHVCTRHRKGGWESRSSFRSATGCVIQVRDMSLRVPCFT